MTDAHVVVAIIGERVELVPIAVEHGPDEGETFEQTREPVTP